MNNQTISTAEPFFFPGGRVGVLLVHGFTGTPREMHTMGEYLNRQLGATCLGIRLAGHATRPKDMVHSRWTDWTASVEDGYNLLSGSVNSIYFAGLSMGGALSLLMSTRLAVKGVIAMSAPYHISARYPAWQIRLASHFKAYLRKTKGEPGSGWFDKEAFKAHISYPLNPVRSVAELDVLLEKMRLALPKIAVPVCLMHSSDDAYVLPHNMEKIHASLAGVPVLEKHYLSGSGHVITRDAAHGKVFEISRNFINRLETGP